MKIWLYLHMKNAVWGFCVQKVGYEMGYFALFKENRHEKRDSENR